MGLNGMFSWQWPALYLSVFIFWVFVILLSIFALIPAYSHAYPRLLPRLSAPIHAYPRLSQLTPTYFRLLPLMLMHKYRRKNDKSHILSSLCHPSEMEAHTIIYSSLTLQAMSTLTPNYPWSVGLSNVTSNTCPLYGQKQSIDSSSYNWHLLADWSIIVESLPLSTVPHVLFWKVKRAVRPWMNKKLLVLRMTAESDS